VGRFLIAATTAVVVASCAPGPTTPPTTSSSTTSTTTTSTTTTSTTTTSTTTTSTTTTSTTTTAPPSWTQQTLLSGLNNPSGVALDRSGNLYVAEFGANRVRKLTPEGTVTTLAFTGLNGPSGVAVGPDGSVYVASVNNQQIKKLTPDGVQTVEFQGGDLSLSTRDVAVDATGTIYISLPFRNSVGRVLPGRNVVSNVPVTTGFSRTWGIALSTSGAVLAVDLGVTPPATEVFGKVAILEPGSTARTLGFTGLRHPRRVAVDLDGNVYVTDGLTDDAVYRLSPDGTQTTLPFTGINRPDGITTDADGNVFVVSSGASGSLFKLSWG
jgi:streptogramin lyase